MSNRVHVAVAVIRNASGEICIARRPEHVHQGGKLEFPGGKVELGEPVVAALQRELEEELGIHVDIHSSRLEPLIKVVHDYADKSVCLDVWNVCDYTGEPFGKEGQHVEWMNADKLNPCDFPEANAPIITALKLPRKLMITPDISGDIESINNTIVKRIECHNPSHVVLRLPRISNEQYRKVAKQLVTKYPAIHWQLHNDSELAEQLNTGLHLPSRALNADSLECTSGNLSASIHSTKELLKAQTLGVDFVLLGAVLPTLTHMNADQLGWPVFEEIVQHATVPVYALGGMTHKHIATAIACGAQGVAGIRLFD